VLRRATGTELDSSGDSLPSIHGTTGTDYNLSSAIPLRSLVFTARRFSNVSDTLPLETRPRRCLDYLPTPAATGGRDESDSRHELHHQSTTTAEAHRCTVSICRASSASPSITSEARPAEDFYLERECQPRVDVARTLISGTRTPSENIEKRNSSKEPRC
jgi:hypothetical protein